MLIIGGWKITSIVNNGANVTINISLAYCLLNSSNAVFNMPALQTAINKSILLCYNVDFYDNIFEQQTIRSGLDNFPSRNILVKSKLLHKVRVTIHSRIIRLGGERKNGEHLLVVQNNANLLKKYARVNKISGSEVHINEKSIPNIISGYDRNTIPHELGHSLGLLHVNQNIHFFDIFRSRKRAVLE